MSELSNLTVREADADAVAQIAEIDAACLATQWSTDVLVDRDRVHVLIAEGEMPRPTSSPERSLIAGHGILWHAADQAELVDLAVRPTYRKSGVATALLDRLIREAWSAGARAVFLEVRASNAAAVALYTGRGLRLAGVRPHYYMDPKEDALILRLDRDSGDAPVRA